MVSTILQVLDYLRWGSISLLFPLLFYFIFKPYRHYYDFRNNLTRSGIKFSSTFLLVGSSKGEFEKATDEVNEWLGEINVLKNTLFLNNHLSIIGIPSKEELDEAIACAAFIRNAMGRKEYVVEVFHKYERLMQIFRINQPTPGGD